MAFLAKEIGQVISPAASSGSITRHRRKRSKRLRTSRGVYDHLLTSGEGDKVAENYDGYYSAGSFRSADRVDRNPIPTRAMTLVESNR